MENLETCYLTPFKSSEKIVKLINNGLNGGPMASLFGPYHLVISPHRNGQVCSAKPDSFSQSVMALEKLAVIIPENIDWVLTGGLALACSMGRSYRANEDIDIGVNRRHLQVLAKAAYTHGYVMASRPIMAKISPTTKIDLYRVLQPHEVEAFAGARLQLLRKNEEGSFDHQGLMSYIDVFPYEVDRGIVHNAGSSFSQESHTLQNYFTPNGYKVPLRNPALLKQMKAARKKPKDLADIAAIEQNLFI
jgi:hypothetical protein